MKLNIFSGLPEYVRMTILSQIRRLLSTPLFSYEDKEDLTQELLLFYADIDGGGVLHNMQGVGVIFQKLPDLKMNGWHILEIWKNASDS